MSIDQSLDSIFCAAIEIESEAELAVFLDQACGDDTQVRQRIERLLAAHRNAGGFMQTESDTTSTVAIGRIGATIGPYKLLELIGEGGFGVVYMAEQLEHMRRRVAIKVIKPGMDTKDVVARFQAERQALAMMDHPNIAKVLDAGATESGRPYFVMELVLGVPINQYCDTNNLSTTKRLELFIQVCQAVQHAHQKGVIHRDIKPTNVMITLHDGLPVSKVIDFGVAKALNQQLTDKTLFTRYGQVIGTPQYMSPEQAEMSGLDVDTRSDIYSLGVLLYELSTGRPPFDGETLRQAGLDEMRRLIREQEPQRPSYRIGTLDAETATTVASHRASQPHTLSNTLKGDLDWIIMKALEKDRNQRYETANQLAEDLRKHLRCEPVLAGPPSAWYLLKKLHQRNRGIVATALIILLAITLGGLISTVGWLSASKDRDRARNAEHAATKSREIAETAARHAHESLSVLVDTMGDLLGPSDAGRPTTLPDVVANLAGRMEERYRDYPELEFGLHMTLGRMLLESQAKPDPRHFARAATLAEQLFGKTSRPYTEALRYRGLAEESIPIVREGVEIESQLDGGVTYQTLSILGCLEYRAKQFAVARNTLQTACDAFGDGVSPSYFEENPFLWLAQVQYLNGQRDAQQATIRRAISVSPGLPPERWRGLGMRHLRNGSLDMAEMCLLASSQLGQKPLEVDDLYHLGRLYRQKGWSELALSIFARASQSSPTSIVLLTQKGRVFEDLWDFDSALPLLSEARQRAEDTESDAIRWWLEFELGLVLDEAGDCTKSRQHMRLVTDRLEELAEKGRPWSHADQMMYVTASQIAGTVMDAKQLVKLAQASLETVEETTPWIAYSVLGQALEGAGDRIGAIEAYEEALLRWKFHQVVHSGYAERHLFDLYESVEQLDRAVEMIPRFVQRRDDALYPLHSQMAYFRIHVGRFLIENARELPLAHEYLREAQDILRHHSMVPDRFRVEIDQLLAKSDAN